MDNWQQIAPGRVELYNKAIGIGPYLKVAIKENSVMGDGVYVDEAAQVHESATNGAGALVTKDVLPHGLVIGQPARLVDYVTRSGQPLNYDLKSGKPPDSAQLEA